MILCVLCIFLIVSISGCTKEKNYNFVGTWHINNADMFTFYSNGSCTMYATLCNWEVISDNELIITIGDGLLGFDIEYNYRFSNDENTLTLTYDEEDITLARRGDR